MIPYRQLARMSHLAARFVGGSDVHVVDPLVDLRYYHNPLSFTSESSELFSSKLTSWKQQSSLEIWKLTSKKSRKIMKTGSRLIRNGNQLIMKRVKHSKKKCDRKKTASWMHFLFRISFITPARSRLHCWNRQVSSSYYSCPVDQILSRTRPISCSTRSHANRQGEPCRPSRRIPGRRSENDPWAARRSVPRLPTNFSIVFRKSRDSRGIEHRSDDVYSVHRRIFPLPSHLPRRELAGCYHCSISENIFWREERVADQCAVCRSKLRTEGWCQKKW